MKKLPVSSIVPGTAVWHECYSDRGELLLTPGTVVTRRHLEQLRKRNVFDLYVLVPPDRPQAPEPQSAPPKHAPSPAREPAPAAAPPPTPAEKPSQSQPLMHRFAVEYEQLRLEDLDRLLRSPVARQLDLSIRRGRQLDRPVGVSLHSSVRQTSPFTRTEAYKADMRHHYAEMLDTLRDFVDTLLSGKNVHVAPLRKTVDVLLRLFSEDPDLVLHLAGIKTPHDDYMAGHMLNACILALSIASAAGYNREQVLTIGVGALLHDIGMPLVPKEIRDKQSRLTPREFAEIQKHPVMGILVLEKIRHLPDPIRYMLYQEHERENGSGYPQRRSSRMIHRFAKIIQIADVFEALTSPRKHRQAYTPFESIEMIIRMSQRGLLSQHFVKAFLAYTSLFPVGSIVELSDGRLARVIHANASLFHRPLVSIVRSDTNKILEEGEIYQLDLAYDESISVVRALPPDFLKGVDFMRGF